MTHCLYIYNEEHLFLLSLSRLFVTHISRQDAFFFQPSHISIFLGTILCVFIWAGSCENMSSGICGQRRSRSACASTMSDQCLYCLLTESSGLGNFRINHDFRIENFHFMHEISLLHLFTRPSFCVKSSYLD